MNRKYVSQYDEDTEEDETAMLGSRFMRVAQSEDGKRWMRGHRDPDADRQPPKQKPRAHRDRTH